MSAWKGRRVGRRKKKDAPRQRQEAGVRVKAAEIEGEGSYSEGIMSVQRVGPDRRREGDDETRGRREREKDRKNEKRDLNKKQNKQMTYIHNILFVCLFLFEG